MARESRSQRRARRAQADANGNPGSSLSQRARARQQAVRPGAQPAKSQGGRAKPERKSSFVSESWGELKKVEWPGRRQVTQGTIVVIIACAIVGAYLYVLDIGMQRLVEQIL